jgi:hypothetical protein
MEESDAAPCAPGPEFSPARSAGSFLQLPPRRGQFLLEFLRFRFLLVQLRAVLVPFRFEILDDVERQFALLA